MKQRLIKDAASQHLNGTMARHVTCQFVKYS
jgi:hypothetical protein